MEPPFGSFRLTRFSVNEQLGKIQIERCRRPIINPKTPSLNVNAMPLPVCHGVQCRVVGSIGNNNQMMVLAKRFTHLAGATTVLTKILAER
jgi:hypothetical protein